MSVVAELNRIRLERDHRLLMISTEMAIAAAKEWDESLCERNSDGTFKNKSGGSSSSGSSKLSAPLKAKQLEAELEKAAKSGQNFLTKFSDTVGPLIDEVGVKLDLQGVKKRASEIFKKSSGDMLKQIVSACKGVDDSLMEKITSSFNAASKAVAGTFENIKKASGEALKAVSKEIEGIRDDMIKASHHPEVTSMVSFIAAMLGILTLGLTLMTGTPAAAFFLGTPAGLVMTSLFWLVAAGEASLGVGDLAMNFIDAVGEERHKRLAKGVGNQFKSMADEIKPKK